MYEIVTLAPGESMATTLDVNYNQYYAAAENVDVDLAAGTALLDGVLGPQAHVIQVATGTPTGPIQIAIHADRPQSARDDNQVCAEADLLLGAGPLDITAYGEKKILIEYAEQQRLRLRVVVHDRDLAARFETQERHEIWAWPVTTGEYRWRSRAIDSIGRSLTLVTEHLR